MTMVANNRTNSWEGENVLELMVQSPSTLFAYWRLTPRYVHIFARTLGVSSKIKLVARLDKINAKYKDASIKIEKIIENIEENGSCYLRELDECCSYRFAVGFYREDSFIVLLHSDIVTLFNGDPCLKKEAPGGLNLEDYSFFS